MNKIEELEEKFHAEVCDLNEKFDKEISELKTELEKQENQEWVPQYLESYWYVDLDVMAVHSTYWANSDTDNIRLQHKVIFKTEDEAKEYLEYLKAKEKAINEFSKEWQETEIKKYYIEYDTNNNTFGIDWLYNYSKINALYFRTRKSAQEFINKYEKMMRRELGI